MRKIDICSLYEHFTCFVPARKRLQAVCDVLVAGSLSRRLGGARRWSGSRRALLSALSSVGLGGLALLPTPCWRQEVTSRLQPPVY